MSKIQSRFIAFVLAITVSGITIAAGNNIVSEETPRPVFQSTADVKIPDTVAGKTFKAFLEAFNSGDINKMKAFHRDRGGDEENAEKDMGFYQQSGGLKVTSVSSSEELAITVVAETKNEGMKVSFHMAVDSQAPHAIQEIRVQPAS